MIGFRPDAAASEFSSLLADRVEALDELRQVQVRLHVRLVRHLVVGPGAHDGAVGEAADVAAVGAYQARR